jgi:small subunit ribosomal protein S6
VINVKYYEIMLIIRTDIEAEEQQEVLNGLQVAITKEGGTVSTVLDWHKRRLSYEIAKHREGQYYLVYFSGQGNIIPELEHFFKVTDAVIRYMIASVEEADFNAAVDKAAAAASAEAAKAAEAVEVAEEPAQAEEAEGSEEASPPVEEAVEAVDEVSKDDESLDKKEDSSSAE